MISTSDDNEVTINNCGINLKDMSDEGNYGEFQTRLIGNGFFFTTDAWGSVATALGRIWIQDSETEGHWATGLIADNVIGNLIAGQSLMITNNKGSMKIDGDTALFTDITINYVDDNGNSVKIGGNEDRIFAIANKDMELLYFDSTKNKMVFSGDVVASTFTGGTITGATVNGTTINGGTVNGGKFIGGSIDIGDGQFTVDKTGHMTARDGEFSGDIVGGSIKIGKNGNEYNFTVDKDGNVDAKSGKFKGDIVASKLYSQQAYDDLVENNKENKEDIFTEGTFIDLDKGKIQIRNDMELIAGNKDANSMVWISTQRTPHKALDMASINLGIYGDGVEDKLSGKDKTEDEKTFRALVHMRSDGYVRFGLASENEESGSIKFNYDDENNDDPELRQVKFLIYTRNFKIAADGTVDINASSLTSATGGNYFTQKDFEEWLERTGKEFVTWGDFEPWINSTEDEIDSLKLRVDKLEGKEVIVPDVPVLKPEQPEHIQITTTTNTAKISFTKCYNTTNVTLVYKTGSTPKSETDGEVIENFRSGQTITGLEEATIYYCKLFAYNKNGEMTASDVFMFKTEVTIVSFATGTWKEIENMLSAHYAGVIDIADYWSVGDEREIIVDDIESVAISQYGVNGYGEWKEYPQYATTFPRLGVEKYKIVIVGMNNETLPNNIGIRSRAAVSLQFRNCLSTVIPIAKELSPGFCHTHSKIYLWLNSVFMSALPSVLQTLIKTIPYQIIGNNGSKTTQTGKIRLTPLQAVLLDGSYRTVEYYSKRSGDNGDYVSYCGEVMLNIGSAYSPNYVPGRFVYNADNVQKIIVAVTLNTSDTDNTCLYISPAFYI